MRGSSCCGSLSYVVVGSSGGQTVRGSDVVMCRCLTCGSKFVYCGQMFDMSLPTYVGIRIPSNIIIPPVNLAPKGSTRRPLSDITNQR